MPDPKEIEKQVNEAIKQLKYNEEKGIWEMPEGLPPEVAVAVKIEKRRRDAQAELTRAQQKLKEKELENQKLQELFEQKAVKLELTEDEKAELDELKYEDPEKWRNRINELEKKAKEKAKEEITVTKEQAKQLAELESRKILLRAFLDDNPDVTEEDLTEKVPVSLFKKLESGEISFTRYLNLAYDFIKSKKVITEEKVKDLPDLDKVGGSAKEPDKNKTVTLESLYQSFTI